MFRLLKKHGTKFRLAVGLTSITVTFMLLVSFLPILPNADQLNIQAQSKVARVVAANGTLLISQNDVKRMEAILLNIINNDTGVLGAEISKSNGEVVVALGSERQQAHLNEISVPIWQEDKEWGKVKLYFKQLYSNEWQAFYQQPLVQFILVVSSLCFIAFFFYLGRMLKMLDPSQAIPDRVRSALDTMAEGLLVLDAKHNIVLANQAFAEIIGLKQAELIGLNALRFNWLNVDGSEFKKADAPWSHALSKAEAVISQRIRLRLNNGLTHTFMVNCSPVLGNNGKAGGVLVSFDDVTVLEQKELELIRSKEEAEIANQTKSDFLANMSHEIRTPMTAIMGFTEVLKRGYGDGQKSAEYLETINKNSRHLLALINDILDLSKVESGQIDVEKVPSPIHHTIGDVIEVLSISAKKKNIDLIYSPAGKIPSQLITDASRLRQILTNLIGNAIKFTQRGSVTVTTRWSKKGCLEIAVKDTGIGMTETQQNNVFAPFVQADSSITRRFGGTGLGLTISKRYAQALGGDISVNSQFGEGSCFTLTINAPAKENCDWVSIEDQKKQRSAVAEETVHWRIPSAKIMVVDDSEENRDLIELLLQSHGLKVVKMANAQSAIERQTKETFDLILMDVQMPGMDGYTAVKKLRANGVTLPIYALTAHAMKGIEQKCLNAGFSGYIGKPIKIDVLVSTLAQCLGGEKLTTEEVKAAPTLSTFNVIKDDKVLDKWSPGEVIRSTFQSNAKYHTIIQRFVEKLELDVKSLNQFLEQADFEGLSELAHKLKGSAGTVGFYDFTTPFHRLEQYSNAKNIAEIKVQLKIIEQMVGAIEKIEPADRAKRKPELKNKKVAR